MENVRRSLTPIQDGSPRVGWSPEAPTLVTATEPSTLLFMTLPSGEVQSVHDVRVEVQQRHVLAVHVDQSEGVIGPSSPLLIKVGSKS
jgi:hypothetical protein